MIKEFPELLPQEVIERVKKLNVPLLCDGYKAAGLEKEGWCCMDAAISPVDHKMTLVGTAMTVDTEEGNNYMIHVASYTAPAEGYIMVVDGKNYSKRAYAGGLIMGACQAVGYGGMVVDGSTRDREDNIALGYPVFSRGFMPCGPVKKDGGSLNTPITCGGVAVEPGDLVVGDSDGVCVIPRRHLDIVLEKAEEKLAYEENREKKIAEYVEAKKTGRELPELAPPCLSSGCLAGKFQFGHGLHGCGGVLVSVSVKDNGADNSRKQGSHGGRQPHRSQGVRKQDCG